jgi:hypothetical protein
MISMLKKTYNIKAKVWVWPGDGGWHFVTLDKKISKEIRSVYTKGFVKISVVIGKSTFNTSLFPHMINKRVGNDVEYLICINKKVRKAEGIFEKEEVKIKVTIV